MMHGECHELMCASYAFHQLRMAIYPPDFPASSTEQLPGTTHRDRTFEHAWQRGNWNMLCTPEDQMLVHFIGNDRHVMFEAQLGNQRQFLAGKHSSSGIMWCVQDHRTCLAGKRGTQFVRVECPGRWMQWYVDRHSMRHNDIWHIRIVIWFDNNDLIARVNKPQKGGEDALRRPRGHNNSMHRVD